MIAEDCVPEQLLWLQEAAAVVGLPGNHFKTVVYLPLQHVSA